MIYFIYIILPHSSLYLIRYYRLIIQIFSAIICRYEMMRSCWLENPLMRPTFAEITKRFQYYLREYKVLSWVFLCLIYWILLSEITEQIYGSPRKANFGCCRKLLVHHYLSATKKGKGKPLSLSFTGPKKKQKSVNLNMAGTRDSVAVNSRGRNVQYKQYYDKFVCLFIYICLHPI